MDGDRISMRGEELSHSCWRWRWGSVVPPTNLKDGGDNDANILYGGEKPTTIPEMRIMMPPQNTWYLLMINWEFNDQWPLEINILAFPNKDFKTWKYEDLPDQSCSQQRWSLVACHNNPSRLRDLAPWILVVLWMISSDVKTKQNIFYTSDIYVYWSTILPESGLEVLAKSQR